MSPDWPRPARSAANLRDPGAGFLSELERGLARPNRHQSGPAEPRLTGRGVPPGAGRELRLHTAGWVNHQESATVRRDPAPATMAPPTQRWPRPSRAGSAPPRSGPALAALWLRTRAYKWPRTSPSGAVTSWDWRTSFGLGWRRASRP